jgi:hypothetical protein
MKIFISLLYLATILSCSAGQQQKEQKVCNSQSNGNYNAELCVKSSNCLNLLPNATCQVELNYYSTYPNTTGPAPARFNWQDNKYYYIFQPFNIIDGSCPLLQANKQNCLITVKFGGNSNNIQPFSAKISNITTGNESEIISSITISGTNN